MITWKMIKELTENPEKEFVSYELQGSRDVLKTKSIKGAIRFSNEEGNWHEVLIGVDLGREWEEVKQPVDFMTAVKSGKRIRIEHDLVNEFGVEDLTHFSSIDCLLYALGEDYNAKEVKDIIVNGKWYIED